MALYTYTCDTCGAEEDVAVPMAAAKAPRACACGATMRRRFGSPGVTWRSRTGAEVRAPSKKWDWEEGRPMDCAEFQRRNPTAGKVGSNPRGA